MKAPLSWLREVVALPSDVTMAALSEAFVRAGLNVESVEPVGHDILGPVVVGRVMKFADEPQKNGKTIRWVQVDVGPTHNGPGDADWEGPHRSVVCGALNFAVGDLVVVSLPGSTLAGGFQIAARKTYGHVSDGMICAEDELGIGHDHTGIIVLPAVDDAGRRLEPGDDPAEALHLRDHVLDIDVTPDMGYCLSIRGLGREAGQAFEARFADPVQRATPGATAAGYPVVLNAPECGLFVAVSVRGIDPTRPTPRWMSRRLVLAGMRSISLAVDITNYVMILTGQPLHAYDADKLSGSIVVRKASAGEQIVTLDGQTRRLDADDLLITDYSGPIGIAGVMGGESTEISAASTNVLIEAANFDPDTISRALRRHGLPSEASKRFHRGVDPNAAYSAAHLVADLLNELAGGTPVEAETIAGGVAAMPTQVIDAALPGRILGLDVPSERVVSILRSSGVTVEVDGDQLSATPPTWRPDLVDAYDYVEEVGRKVGFDALPSLVPVAPAGRGLTHVQLARRAVTRALVDAGLVELLTLPFLASSELDALAIPANDERRQLVRLANPLAETSPYLRSTLLPGLFAAVARNTSRGNDDLSLFETGSVFYGPTGVAPIPSVAKRPSAAELAEIEAALPSQPKHLAIVLAGAWRKAGWQGAGEAAGWQQAFALADVAATAVGATFVRSAAEVAPWHPGRCAALSVVGEVIGYAGELHPDVVRAAGLPSRTCAVELNVDALIRLAPDNGTIAPLSSHPVAKEDVALVVDAAVTAGDVAAALTEGAGALLESVGLFDVFTGGAVPAGKKSLAFALRFRAPDRTLAEAEIAAAKGAAVASAHERTGAELRSF